jgi:hypothetical protein
MRTKTASGMTKKGEQKRLDRDGEVPDDGTKQAHADDDRGIDGQSEDHYGLVTREHRALGSAVSDRFILAQRAPSVMEIFPHVGVRRFSS